MDIRGEYKLFKESIYSLKFNRMNQIRYYNFWTTQLAKEIWFTKFIEHHGLLKNYKGKVNFYSVLGTTQSLRKRKHGVNIFFSGENMLADRFNEYKHVCDEKPFDFSMGFEYSENQNYLRFPLWIMTLFDPTADFEDIKKRVKQLSDFKPDERTGFCSLVASHDWNGIRGQMIKQLSVIGDVSSGGKFRNNTDDLNVLYDNNKFDFVRQYKFNICPENSNALGYVTEKIFQAIEAGSIPIYWGADNNPEPDILNKNAIIFWDINDDNKNSIKQIETLFENKNEYIDYISQPRLKTGAEDIIWNYYTNLQHHFKTLFQ